MLQCFLDTIYLWSRITLDPVSKRPCMYSIVLFTLSFQGGVITSVLCLTVHCKRCWSVGGGPGVSDHNDLTRPLLCLLAPGSIGWPFDGHLQGPHWNRLQQQQQQLNDANSVAMSVSLQFGTQKTEWLSCKGQAQLLLSRTRLDSNSYMRSELHPKRQNRVTWDDAHPLAVTKKKGRRRQANWNCSSRNLTTNSEAPPSKLMKIQLLTTGMVNTGLYLESWSDSNKRARIFMSDVHFVRHARCMQHITFCGHRLVAQC